MTVPATSKTNLISKTKQVSPFCFSIFADDSIFTRNFYSFFRGKPSSTRTTKTGKSNTNFLTHREAVSIFIIKLPF